jgi:murein L,D-transpeptidase YcbB/YkuD
MKRIGFVFLALIICLGLTISGCSSAQKKLSEEVKGVKTRVDTLETRVEGVETKQAEQDRMTMEQAQRVEEMKSEKARPSSRTNVGIKERRSSKDRDRTKEIQSCLKNAGFYHGEIDGVKGRKTKAAIKKFQKANGLTADGIAGNKTWEALSKYSAAGAPAAAASPAEEEASAGTK